MAKGLCCGYVSLRIILLAIALIDITLGGAAIGIGVVGFLSYHLDTALIVYVTLNSCCFLLALGSLYAI